MKTRHERTAGAGDADADLFLRSAAGDPTAFDALVARNRRWVLNLIYRCVGDLTEAEDLAQEAFVRLYTSRGRYRPSARFSTFLRRIVVNLCLNEVRRRRRHPAKSVDGLALEPLASGDSPEHRVERDELSRHVMDALMRLPENQRMATVLSRYEGLSYREIADAMDCSVKAVEGLLHRAGLALMKHLSDYVQTGLPPDPDPADPPAPARR